MRILIVDDDVVVRERLDNFMSRYGDCKVAIDGVEALDEFLAAHEDSKAYDLIFLDIMMPKLDGVQTLKAIREYEEQKSIDLGDRAKVIMTTALNDKKTVIKSYEIGCDAYARKPLDFEKINDVLNNLKLIES